MVRFASEELPVEIAITLLEFRAKKAMTIKNNNTPSFFIDDLMFQQLFYF